MILKVSLILFLIVIFASLICEEITIFDYFDNFTHLYPVLTWEELGGRAYEIRDVGYDFYIVKINGVYYLIKK